MKKGYWSFHLFGWMKPTRSAYIRLQSSHFLYFLMLVWVFFYSIMSQKSNIYEWFSSIEFFSRYQPRKRTLIQWLLYLSYLESSKEGGNMFHHSVKFHSPSKTRNIFSHTPSFLDAQPSNCLLVHIPGNFYGCAWERSILFTCVYKYKPRLRKQKSASHQETKTC